LSATNGPDEIFITKQIPTGNYAYECLAYHKMASGTTVEFDLTTYDSDSLYLIANRPADVAPNVVAKKTEIVMEYNAGCDFLSDTVKIASLINNGEALARIAVGDKVTQIVTKEVKTVIMPGDEGGFPFSVSITAENLDLVRMDSCPTYISATITGDSDVQEAFRNLVQKNIKFSEAELLISFSLEAQEGGYSDIEYWEQEFHYQDITIQFSVDGYETWPGFLVLDDGSTYMNAFKASRGYLGNGLLLDAKADKNGIEYATLESGSASHVSSPMDAAGPSTQGTLFSPTPFGGYVTFRSSETGTVLDESKLSFLTKDGKVGAVGYINGKLRLQGTWEPDAQASAVSTTSDATKKHDIASQSDVYSRIFDRLNPVTFKYNNGDSGRTHTGLIAQEVEQAVLAEGLTTQDFAAVTYNINESGEKVDYGVRYEELVSMCIREIQLLKQDNAELRRQLEELKNS
jgi:hypothetical protein